MSAYMSKLIRQPLNYHMPNTFIRVAKSPSSISAVSESRKREVPKGTVGGRIGKVK